MYLRSNVVRKDGTSSINLMLIIDGKTKLYNTNYSVRPDQWDGARVKSKHKLAMQINNMLDEMKVKADNVILQLIKDKVTVTKENFENAYFKNNENEISNLDFYEVCLNYIELYKKNYKYQTHKQHLTEISKLKKFKPTLTFEEVNLRFMDDYELYMINTLNNAPNTVAKTFKNIKMFMNLALSKGVIQENPIVNYKLKKVKTTRTYLSMEEVATLEDIYMRNELSNTLHTTLKCFLFSCYTGLRYQDILHLDYTDITNEYILLVLGKTNEQITIPLIDNAKGLIDQSQKSGKVFTVFTNQKCNDYLKLIMLHAKINKSVSFHTARHTFATISLNIGIPMEVVSKLLGHADLKTTMIYAKLFEKTKFDQMDKWNKR